MQALTETEDWMYESHARNGLGLLDQDHGATAWSIVSAPTKILQEEYDFYYDAFALLEVRHPIGNSTLTVFNRDIRREDTFEQQETLNIITARSPNGQQALGEIIIGSSMPLIGSVAFIGQNMKRGLSIRINEQNRTGGIKGYHVKAIVYNDSFTPFLARQNINRLVTIDNTQLMLLPVGSATLASYIDYAKQNNMAILFPTTGATQFRNRALWNLINFRASLKDEVYALIDHLHTTFATQTYAFFYQDDAYGADPLQSAHQALEKRGITSWLDLPYSRESTDFSSQVEQIKHAQPEAIGLFCTAAAAQEFMRQIGIEQLAHKKLFTFSLAGDETLRHFASQHGIEILFSSVVPSPHGSQLEIVREYRQAMDRNFYPYNNFSLEAYMATSLLMQVLETIGAPPFSNENIIEIVASYINYQFKGLTLTFNAERRDLSLPVWLETNRSKEWTKIAWDQSNQTEQT